MKAIRQIITLAHDDPTINPWRQAPARVQKLAAKSQPLPDTIAEVALRMANGLWPENLRIAVEPANTSKPLRADLLAVGY